jgi:hypothetical protein
VAEWHGEQHLSDEAGAVPGKELEVEVVGEFAGDLGVRPAVVVRDREAVAKRRDQERQDERHEREPLSM